MTKRQAKRSVLSGAAESLLADIDCGAEYLYEKCETDADRLKIDAAVRELAAELSRRGGDT